MSISDVIARIRAYRLAKGWSILRLGTEAGIGESTIRKMDRPEWNPTKEVLSRIEAIIPKDWAPGQPASTEDSENGKAA